MTAEPTRSAATASARSASARSRLECRRGSSVSTGSTTGRPSRTTSRPHGEGERETLLVREGDDGVVEVALRVPSLGERHFDLEDAPQLDRLCQLIEGVSHFVYFVDRAQGDRETTALEMELQAEVDKYVDPRDQPGGPERGAQRRASASGSTTPSGYAHEAHTELGERYRVANRAAHRFVHRLERSYVARRPVPGDARPSCALLPLRAEREDAPGGSR